MSTRLTNSDKREIVSIIMKKAKEARQEKLDAIEAEKHALGDDVYLQAVYTPRQHELMAELGDKFFESSDQYGVSVDGKYVRLFMSKERPFAVDDIGYRRAVIEITERPELYEKMKKLEEGEQEVYGELQQLEREVSATVNRASTNKRLIDIWPDIEDVVAQVCPEVGVTKALVIPINRLNLAIEGKIKATNIVEQTEQKEAENASS